MSRTAVGVLLAVGMMLAVSQETASQSGIFLVVVNATNPAVTLSKDEVSALFLKKKLTWADGRTVMPVDLPDRSPVRGSFSRTIHGRDVTAVKSYWQRMIFSGTAVPPPEKATEDEVIAFVRRNPGAIGYVGGSTVLPTGVRSLGVSD